ncbi:MAG: hypothetical protein KatS3mg087_1631 [Patescibacteria group bacterium]|nr:MAG: hypothetical protein KatS3mg087_1631 [Patescibacteria group bacterium]
MRAVTKKDKKLIDLAVKIMKTAVELDCPILQTVCQHLKIPSSYLSRLVSDEDYSPEAREMLQQAIDFVKDKAAAKVFEKAVNNDVDARVFNLVMKNMAGWGDEINIRETRTLNVNFKKIEEINDQSKLVEIYREALPNQSD